MLKKNLNTIQNDVKRNFFFLGQILNLKHFSQLFSDQTKKIKKRGGKKGRHFENYFFSAEIALSDK